MEPSIVSSINRRPTKWEIESSFSRWYSIRAVSISPVVEPRVMVRICHTFKGPSRQQL